MSDILIALSVLLLKDNKINCGTCCALSELHIVRSFSPIIILDLDDVPSPGVPIHEIQALLMCKVMSIKFVES